MKRMKIFRLLGAVAIVIAIGSVSFAAVAAGAARQQARPAAPAAVQGQNMMMGQGMMGMRQQMMADQQASLARLQQLTEAMNAAKGDAKVAAIAAAVSELVQQYKTAQERTLMPMMMMPMTGAMPGMPGAAPPAKNP